MKNKYVDLEVLNHGLKELATKINSVFRKIKDSYTKTEIDDKFTSMAKGMNWKPSVATKVDLEALTDNSRSDTRIVEDESKIYMYNGTSWEGIGSSANVPKATIDNDGLMSKEDFTKLEGIEPDKYETKEDFNTKVGSLTSLNTDNKDSVVSAINEVKEGVNNTVKIDDTVVDTNKVYSSKKINDTYVQKEENKSLVLDSEIEKIHKHSNIDSLNKISEDENGNPLYNGKLIQAEKEIWTGTKEEYNAITDKKDDITYIVTDEEDNLDINSLVVDDTKTSTNTTWSSKKTNEEFIKIHKKNTSVTTTVYQWFVARYDSQTKQVSITIPIAIADDVSNVSLNFGDKGVLLHTGNGEVEKFPTQVTAIGIEDSKSLGLLRFDMKVDVDDTSISCIAIPADTIITFS